MHIRTILTFSPTTTPKQIQAACNEWATNNVDQIEHGHRQYDVPIMWMSTILEDETAAREYLNNHGRAYEGVAVKYYEISNRAPSTKEKTATLKVDNLERRLRKLAKPHYKGAKSQTVTCKKCGSKLATAYCGTTWYNHCPVCRADVRPASILAKEDSLNEALQTAKKELRLAEREANQKNRAKAKICTAVIVDVHS